MRITDYKIEQLEDGARKAFANAKSLHQSGGHLIEIQKYPLAVSVIILASEEMAKAKFLLHIAMDKKCNKQYTAEELKEINKAFFNHEPKLASAARTDFEYNQLAESIGLEKVRPDNEIVDDILNPKKWDLIKQQGFYLSMDNTGFNSPDENLKAEHAQNLYDLIKLRLTLTQSTLDVFFQYPDFYLKKWKEGTNGV